MVFIITFMVVHITLYGVYYHLYGITHYLYRILLQSCIKIVKTVVLLYTDWSADDTKQTKAV